MWHKVFYKRFQIKIYFFIPMYMVYSNDGHAEGLFIKTIGNKTLQSI